MATTASTRPPATATPATDVEASPTSEDRQAENSGEITVQYRVSGDAKSANIIYVVYEGEKGESRQATVKLPWKKSFDAMEGEFVYVSSQASKRSGSVKCEIVVDGESFKEERADGSSGVASCEGMIGEK